MVRKYLLTKTIPCPANSQRLAVNPRSLGFSSYVADSIRKIVLDVMACSWQQFATLKIDCSAPRTFLPLGEFRLAAIGRSKTSVFPNFSHEKIFVSPVRGHNRLWAIYSDRPFEQRRSKWAISQLCGPPNYACARTDLAVVPNPAVPPQAGGNTCIAGSLTSCGNLSGGK